MSHKEVLRNAFSDFVTKYHAQLPELKRKQKVSPWEVHVLLVRHDKGHTPLIVYVCHTERGPVFLAHTIPKTLDEIRKRLERAEEMLGAHVYPKFGTETGHAPDIPWGEAATKALRLLLAAALRKQGVSLKDLEKSVYSALLHFASRETIRAPFGRQERIVGPLLIQENHADATNVHHIHLYDAGEFRQLTSEKISIVHPEEPIVLVWASHLQEWSRKGLERFMGRVEKRVRPTEPVPGR